MEKLSKKHIKTVGSLPMLDTKKFDFFCGNYDRLGSKYEPLGSVNLYGFGRIFVGKIGGYLIHHSLDGEALSANQLYNSDVYDLYAAPKKSKEEWAAILTTTNLDNDLVTLVRLGTDVSQSPFQTEEEALAYQVKAGWKVSHAIKIWPKE